MIGGRWRRIPLRARLTTLAAVAVAVAVLILSTTVYFFTRAQLRSQFDEKLFDQATAVVASLRPGPGRSLLLPDQRAPWDAASDIPLLQLIYSDGQVVAPEDQARLPITPRDLATTAGGSQLAYTDIRIAGRHYRMLTMPIRTGAIQFARRPVDIEESLTKLTILLLTLSAAGIAGAALLGWFVSRAGLAPVDRLTAAAEHVARTQDLTAAIAVQGDDELARLGQAFNAMLAALGASRDAQRRLVEDAGHELRTPLTSLRTNVELLIRADETGRDIPPADRAKLLHDLNGQMIELTQLITELVELTRNENSEEPPEPIDLADVVMAAVERARVRTPAVEIEAELESTPLIGRASALERAVLNILDNATKWTPEGEPVRVRLSRGRIGGRDCARLDVDDAGPGVPEDDRPRVFERFYRAADARALPGSGLGLAIVHQAVTAHGGLVGVEEGPRGGALFTVVIPCTAPVPAVI